jgi:hypothetical protein
MSATTTPLVPVMDGQTCIGHLLRRGPAGVEAFNKTDASLGLFPNDREAASAVWRRAREEAAP